MWQTIKINYAGFEKRERALESKYFSYTNASISLREFCSFPPVCILIDLAGWRKKEDFLLLSLPSPLSPSRD
jgi:hypothetical protein